MNEVIDKPEVSTALTLPQRAAVALGTSEHEKKLRDLVKGSASIVAVKNLDGRTECHAAYMRLKNARVAIDHNFAAATEDAKAFTKAVKEEKDRLIEIASDEEERLQALRDKYDADVKAEKEAKIAAERTRIEGIQKLISQLRDYPRSIVASDPAILSVALTERIDEFDGWAPHVDDYAEFVPVAAEAIAESLATMRKMRDAALLKEAAVQAEKEERERLAAEQLAENERLASERIALERQRAEFAEKVEQQERQAAIDRQAADDAAAEARRIADAEAAESRRKEDAALAVQRAELKRQQDEIDEKNRVAAEAEKHRLEAVAAERAEAERIAQVEADRVAQLAKDQAAAEEAERIRIADAAHRKQIHDDIAAALTTFGIAQSLIGELIPFIAAGSVPHVSINY